MIIERKRNTIRNSIWGYVYKIISLLMPFIFRTVIIRSMGAEYVGISGLFTSILQVINLSELGFGSAIVYSMYRPIAEGDVSHICALLNYYKRVYRIIGTSILVVGLLLTPFIPNLIEGNYPRDINIYYVYILFLLNTSLSYYLFAYKSALLSAFQRNDVESKILIIYTIIRYSLEIFGIIYTRNYYSVLLIEIISTGLLNVLKKESTDRMYPWIRCIGKLPDDEKKRIKKDVLALLCHKIGGTVLNSADTIVLSAFMGVIAVANFGNYYFVLAAVEGLILVVFSGMTAGIGNAFVKESKYIACQYFRRILFFNGWIVCLLSVCFACLVQDFISLWVGEQYLFDDVIMLLFVVYFFVHMIRRTIITFRDAAGMWEDNKLQPIVSASTNIVINIVLVNIIGVKGILLSSIFCMILIDIPWETSAFCKKIDLERTEYIQSLLSYLGIAILGVCSSYCICKNIVGGVYYRLIIKGIVGILVSNIIFWLFLHNKEEYVYFSDIIRNGINTFNSNENHKTPRY